METNWREIIDMVANGQRAMTQIEAIRAIVDGMKYDSEKLAAIRAILGIKEAEKDV